MAEPTSNAMTGQIRVIVIGALIHDDALLAMRVLDPEGRLIGVRPLGGGVEFDETSTAALIREFREEIGAEVIVGANMAVFENRFTYAGRRLHELVLVRPARFRDPGAAWRPEYEITEDTGGRFTAAWFPLERLRAGEPPLFPPGLVNRLEELQ